MKEMNVIVVHEGHRFYKEDGTDDYLEVTAGNAVRSGHSIYMVESDYIKTKEWLDKTGDA